MVNFISFRFRVMETGVHRESHQPAAGHCQTLSHESVSNTQNKHFENRYQVLHGAYKCSYG